MTTAKKIPSISMKSLGFNAKELRKLCEDKKEAVFVARIGGIASQFFTGESKFGDWVGFKGDFSCVTHEKEVLEASTAFLPSTIANALVERLKQGEVEIEVIADIFVIETDKNASGYAYMCEPVMSESADRRKQEINKRLLAAKLPTQLALAGPTEKAEKKKA